MPEQDTAHPTIKNLETTHIQLDPPAENSLGKDAYEIITGVSSSAVTMGGKITTGIIIYTGHESLETSVASKILSVFSLFFTILDFLRVPIGYLIKLFKKEEVPFNRENNIKWALAGLSLLLSIISAAATATAQIISFITAGVAIIGSIAAVIKYFHDYKKTGEQFQASILKVESLTQKIRDDMQEINDLQNKIRLMDSYAPTKTINPLVIHLASTYQRYYRHCEKLKATYVLKNSLERRFIREKSPIELATNCVKLALAGVVLAGTVLSLNPATMMIGMGLLASAAIIGLMVLVGKIAIQLFQKRKERKLENLRNRDIEISVDSTVKVMQQLNTNPSPTIKLATSRVTDKITKPNAPNWRAKLFPANDSETVPLLKSNSDSESDEPSADLQTGTATPTRW